MYANGYFLKTMDDFSPAMVIPAIQVFTQNVMQCSTMFLKHKMQCSGVKIKCFLFCLVFSPSGLKNVVHGSKMTV